ncbi:unnamed protein product [Candidula unifasciata]|uniref:GST N-terminal domain-containing protein n=1 Tax=Candidula unifasciata TaxID=100452 RepID=A0A8S3ZGX3_9EUPU|nr:unnamed protein product [Candidula unifasciata]
MSHLKADIPQPRQGKAYDPSPPRHPSLTPQWRWAQKNVVDVRFIQRTMLLGFSKFKILSRTKKGRAELIRLLLTYADIPFDDHLLRDLDWKCLMCKMPYGNLPVLWIDHNVYGEPSAIIRFLARHLGLLGNSETESLTAEAVLHQVQDLKESEVMQKAYEEMQELPDDNFEKLMKVLLPQHFTFWTNHVQSTPGPFILGSGISVADLAIYDFINQYKNYIPLHNLLIDYKDLHFLCTQVKLHPRLAQYIKRNDD